jgi:RNA polymerase-binding transcription factor DksA
MNASLPRTAAWLRTRQYELADRLQRLNRDMQRVNDPLVQDSPDQAAQRQNDEVIDQLRAATESELDRIEAALTRIAAGSYGRCERCAELIDVARLEALPESALCKSCASNASMAAATEL